MKKREQLNKFKSLIRLVKGEKRPIDTFKESDPNRDLVMNDWIADKTDIGILMRDEFVVFDIDPRNGGKTTLNNFDLLSLETLIQKTSGGGYHLFFKRDTDPKNLIKFKGIDIIYGNKYVKYYGIFEKESSILPLSACPSFLFKKEPERQHNQDEQKHVKIPVKKLKRVLDLVDPVKFKNDNEGWLIFISSFLTLYPLKEEGREELLEWSLRDLTYDYNDVAKRVRSLDGAKGYQGALAELVKKQEIKAYQLLLDLIAEFQDSTSNIKTLRDRLKQYSFNDADSFPIKIEKMKLARQLKIKARAQALISAIDEENAIVKQHHFLSKYALEFLIFQDFKIHFDSKLKQFLYFKEELNRYEYIDSTLVKALVESYMYEYENLSKHLNNTELKAVLETIERILIDDHFDFLEDTPYISFASHTLHVDKLNLKCELINPDPHCITHLYIPNKIDIKSAETPIFDDLIHNKIFEILPEMDRIAVYDFFIDFFAHLILPYKLVPKIFLFVGSGHNGKTLITELAREIIGHKNCLFTQIHRLLDSHNNHASDTFVGKLAVIDDDFDVLQPLNTSKLKSLSETKFFDANPKNKKNYESRSMFAPIILTNNEPYVKDISEGFIRRLVYIKFYSNLSGKFSAGERVIEKMKETKEIDKLLNKIICRTENVLKGEMRTPQIFEKEKKAFLNRSNPFLSFLSEVLTETDDPNDKISILQLYKVHKRLRNFYNYRLLSYDIFSRILSSAPVEIVSGHLIKTKFNANGLSALNDEDLI